MGRVLTPAEALARVPQQEPFRFVDDLLELSAERAVGRYRWRPSADFYRGHFPGNPGQTPYTMVKAGLDALTKSLAQELAGRPILVNSVAPGFIDTEMTQQLPAAAREAILARIPLGRMGAPDEVAEVVAWLATRASYVHGTVIHVNGGMYGG